MLTDQIPFMRRCGIDAFVVTNKATRDAIQHKMINAPEMANVPDMPFDGKRMIWGGFRTEVEFRRESAA